MIFEMIKKTNVTTAVCFLQQNIIFLSHISRGRGTMMSNSSLNFNLSGFFSVVSRYLGVKCVFYDY